MAIKISKPGLPVDRVQRFFENESEQRKYQVSKYAKAALWYLNQGKIRAWDPVTSTVNMWVKRAILSYFKEVGCTPMSAGCFEYYDKLPLKRRSSMPQVRVLPGAIVRYGCFVESGAILMPSFINVGAYVGKGTMIDTWATVGSCAQIGSHCHLSGGVGIGGVLEPAHANPVIIEEGVFIGSRTVIVEGVKVEREAVIGAGVVLTASTKIVDIRENEPRISTGIVPARAVVIPGVYPKKIGITEYGISCALIIGSRQESTDLKTSLNGALRTHGVSV